MRDCFAESICNLCCVVPWLSAVLLFWCAGSFPVRPHHSVWWSGSGCWSGPACHYWQAHQVNPRRPRGTPFGGEGARGRCLSA
jgi:hypothetical protein